MLGMTNVKEITVSRRACWEKQKSWLVNVRTEMF